MDRTRREKLYGYQQEAIDTLFKKIEASPVNYKLLYQLPTGGGKTVIFAEIARRYIARYSKKVMILTHRIELCRQTSGTLKMLGTKNRVINSQVKKVRKDSGQCFVAMVETLKNRIEEGQIATGEFGLVIIDEAHYNAFHKLLDEFSNAIIIGVTATPLSSDPGMPMNKNFDELIVGESISSLIKQGFLAKPISWRYDVELNTLKIGSNGDFTGTTSDEFYSSPAMLSLLLQVYKKHSKNKKTLIFNQGIFSSREVCRYFSEAGYNIRHLDNSVSPVEREEILKWYKRTKNAILTSVSILTTGFDEPTVQTIILNRATTSLTLYHQMIGRGSRRLSTKKTFTIIDLGNNVERFGEWNSDIDWKNVFERPEEFYEYTYGNSSQELHSMPSELRTKFPNSLEISFDIQSAYHECVERNEKPITVIHQSIRQHALMCVENATNILEAISLSEVLDKEITWRVKQYTKCLGNVTRNYREWLEQDYRSRLKILVQKIIQKQIVKKEVA